MDGSIRLTSDERKRLLKAYRSGRDRHRSRSVEIVNGGRVIEELVV